MPPGIATSFDDGERLSEAFEICKEWQPDINLEFDQAVLLARGVTRNEEIELARCSTCKCALVIDRPAILRDNCNRCRRQARKNLAQRSRTSPVIP